MAGARAFSGIVAAIMDTTHDPESWPVALRQVAGYCGCDGAILVHRNGTAGPIWSVGETVSAPELIRASNLAARGQPCLLVLETRHLLACPISSAEAGDWVIGLCSDAPPGGECEHRLMLLQPHIRKAIEIQRQLAQQAARHGNASLALDSLSTPLIIVDGQCAIIHANRPAKRMIAQGAIIRTENGRLAAGPPQTTAQLWAAVSGFTQSGSTATASDIGFLSSQEPVLLKVRSLGRNGADHGAAVFVATGDSRKSQAAETMVDLFGLTPVEGRVLVASLEGLPPADVARSLGVATSTVKTHLNRIYRKTGTTNQGELLGVRNRLILP